MPAPLDESVATPPIATKLKAPQTPRFLILRRRLFDVLDRGVEGRLVLLSAPPGAGKTVLLSSWLAVREPPKKACWITLDEDDDDVSCLMADLLNSLRRSGAAPEGGLLDRLSAPTPARMHRFLPMLVNALAELPSPVLVVLDDIHHVSSPPATAAVDFLVRHVPEHCTLVLSGRSDPPLPIQRMRMSEELVELRHAELAFDRAETQELCERLELELSDGEIGMLWTRTEGWAAALRLAALSLNGHPDPRRFLEDLGGTDRALADYLIAEVLVHLPEDQHAFMLRTCLVDAVSAPLADALTESHSSALVLAAIEHSGAPIEAVSQAGGDDCLYRYHPLFKELLQAHLRHAYAPEIPLLERRAAAWYAENGLSMQALHHALAAEDWRSAGELIAENWLELFLSGSSPPVRRAIRRLPAEIVKEDPRLAAVFACSRLEEGDLREGERHLAQARQRYREADDAVREQLGLMLAAAGLRRARLQARVDDAERLAGELIDLASGATREEWSALRCFALSNLGAVHLWSGNLAAASGDLEEALALATEDGREHLILSCLAQLGVVDLLRGRLTSAEERSKLGVELAERCGFTDGSASACAYLVSGAVAYGHGEFDSSVELLTHAATAAATAEWPVRLATGVLQARALAAIGQRSASRGLLKLRAVRAEVARNGSAIVPRFLDVALADTEARALLAAGETESARQALSRALGTQPRSRSLLVREAAAELDGANADAASSALTAALADRDGSAPSMDEPDFSSSSTIEAWVLRALLARAIGERKASTDALEHALSLAEHEPYRDAFLLHGRAVRELLEHQAHIGTDHPALVEVLLDAMSDRRTPSLEAIAEPLTEREQRILSYLPTMLSNAEIGAETFVSLNTVKTHLRSIYRKLDVSSRAEAVERGRLLGLLPSGIKRPRPLRRA
ncbi:MAG TPA: LuxR C-terminal-related transcriptional regulator [Solirubrobacteraceae bacterium]|jgi:LuxR family maltose regulon positive regulatory protein|nr:LuxR C-terminal-related transcriptional regulator [Solirubrobacteraceae bacterium]